MSGAWLIDRVRVRRMAENGAPFNFRTSVKASDSKPEPVLDVFLKIAGRNDEVSTLGRKDDFRVRYPRRANIFCVKEPQGVTKKLLK